MKYKGKLKNVDDLPKGNLPLNAVKFKEPKNTLQLNLVAALFIIPVLLLVFIICVIASMAGTGNVLIIGGSMWGFVALILAFLSIPIHELLHGICFGKDAEVSFYYTKSIAMTYSNDPISKRRFIWLSLCPQIVLGWLPLLIWAFIPMPDVPGAILFFFGVLSALFGAGDDMNVFNAIRQMPKGSMQQLSGFNSYWFMPDEDTDSILSD